MEGICKSLKPFGYFIDFRKENRSEVTMVLIACQGMGADTQRGI